MDATETYFALRERGIRIRANETRDRLYCEPADSLTAELCDAFSENHDRMLAEELLRETVGFVCARVRREEGISAGQRSYSPAARTVYESTAASQERIAEAIDTQDLETFKQTLRQWSRTALRTYQTAREHDDGKSDPSARPALSSTDPVQESLLG